MSWRQWGGNFICEDDTPVNGEKIKDIKFPVNCKISLYPMGVPNYMKYIVDVVNHSIDLGFMRNQLTNALY